MGSIISTVIYQPLLLSTAVAMMIIALIYQYRSSTCNNKTDNWGQEIFKINVGLAAVIVIIAVIINFMSGFTL
jgi:hypothetical protein